ncbi:GTP 3',8-cyclase, mitochondrial-like, partial [Stegodyphus dumicola]|uniref:GTP 3',8-cyclase, mitochondrial-like n=1 Tax=Stegodyphus dumicola TaxID=202533 RepID=UPI0015B09FEC
LNAVNISLDTLVPAKFEFLTRRKGWNNVMKSINSCLDQGFNPVKINCVVMRGINDDELGSFVRMTEKMNIDIRFIEYSPFNGNKWNKNKLVPYFEMVSRIKNEFPELQRIKDQSHDTSKGDKDGHIVAMDQNTYTDGVAELLKEGPLNLTSKDSSPSDL